MDRDAAALDPLIRERPPKVLDASELPLLMPPPLERLLLKAAVNVLLPMEEDEGEALRPAPARDFSDAVASAEASSPVLTGGGCLGPSSVSLPPPSPLRLLLPVALRTLSPLRPPPLPPPTERPNDLLASALTPCTRESPEKVALPAPPRLRLPAEKLLLAAKLLVRLASGILAFFGLSTPAPLLSPLPATGDAAAASSSTVPVGECLGRRDDGPSAAMLFDVSNPYALSFAFRDLERLTLRLPEDGPSSTAVERLELKVLARASRRGGRLLVVGGTTSASSPADVAVVAVEVGGSPTAGAGADAKTGSATAGSAVAAGTAADPFVSAGGTESVASEGSAWDASTATGRGDDGTTGGANGTSSTVAGGDSVGLAS